MEQQERISLVKQFIDFDGDLDVLREKLSTYAWDFEGVPAVIDKTVIESVLSRYIVGSLTVTQLYKWADFLELRDDVGYLEGDQEFLSEVIHTLANPDLEGTFTTNKAKEVLSKL